MLRVATGAARLAYGALKAVVPQRRRVVFLSRQSDEPSRDYRMLADELRRIDPGVEIAMHCKMIGRGAAGLTASAVHTLRQMVALAAARVVVVDGYVLPVSLLDHKPGVTVFQMWHALGAIKRFGKQTLDRPEGHTSEFARTMRMHENYDVVLCSGPETVGVYAEAFGTDKSKVAITGLPRIDHLLAHATDRSADVEPASVRSLRERFPLLRDRQRRVVLYAPTLRRASRGRVGDVVGRLGHGDITLVVKPHPLESAAAEGPSVVNAQGVDILDLLPLCDVVITDYSAVALEAAVIGVPVLFWTYDIEAYREDCGLNIDPASEFPDATSRDLEPLACRVETGLLDDSVVRALRTRVVSTLDGCCTERIARMVLEPMDGV